MKLSLYIAKQVFFIFLVIIFAIIAIDFVFGVIGEIRVIGENNYTWHNAILYILFRIPTDIELILPIAGFLGTLIALLIFSSKSELIAMRAAGFSMQQLGRAVLITGGALLIFYYLLSFFIAPYTRHFSYLEGNLQDKNQNILALSSETWLKSGNHYLLMGQVLPDGEINNVTDFLVQDNMLSEVRKIGSIVLHSDNSWTLNDVTIMQLSDQGVQQRTVPSIVEQSLIARNLLPALAMAPDEMTINTLYEYIQFRDANKLNVKSYKLQFWNRIFAPLMLPILMLMAIPFGISSNRKSIQLRLVVSLIIGFSFYIISQFFGSFTLLSAIPPILGASLPIVIFGAGSILVFNLKR